MRAKAVDGEGTARSKGELGPHHAADADCRAFGGEGLLVADMEAVAGPDVAFEVHCRCERAQRLQHGGARHAELGQRLVERGLDHDACRDLAREGLVGEEACIVVGTAQHPLLGDARVFDRRAFGSLADRHRTKEERRGERRSKRGLLHKNFPDDPGVVGTLAFCRIPGKLARLV